MHQRIRVNAFKRAREWKRIPDCTASSFSRSQAEDWPQTFTTGKQTVTHGPVKCGRLRVRLWQIAVQRPVDQLLAGDQIIFDIHLAKRLLLVRFLILDNATVHRLSSSIKIDGS